MESFISRGSIDRIIRFVTKYNSRSRRTQQKIDTRLYLFFVNPSFRKQLRIVATSLALFVAGVVSAGFARFFGPVPKVAVPALLCLIAIVRLGIAMRAVYMDVRKPFPHFGKSDVSVSRLGFVRVKSAKVAWKDLRSSPALERQGFRIRSLPYTSGHFEFSPELNAQIATTRTWQCREGPDETFKHFRSFSDDPQRASFQRAFLLSKVRDESDAKLKDMAHTTNESKFGMRADLSEHLHQTCIYRVGYYDSMVTNEAFSSCIIPRNAKTGLIDASAGEEMSCQGFPAHLVHGQGQEYYCLDDLTDAELGNHVGISTIGLTTDGRLVLFQQGIWNEQGAGTAVVTGSGSVDHDDVAASGAPSDLLAIVRYAMVRELMQEGGPAHRNDEAWKEHLLKSTLVTGFFRWVERCGKPEFVGITRLPCRFAEYKPDNREVIPLDHESGTTITSMKSFIEYVEDYETALAADQVRPAHERMMRPLHLSSAVCLYTLAEIASWAHETGVKGKAFSDVSEFLFAPSPT